MGAWGTGLYQNDIGLEIKDDYRDKLRAGKTEDEAYAEIMQEYKDIIADEAEKFDVFFSLADTMWNLGRLNDEVKNIALSLIDQECADERWSSQKDVEKRKIVLNSLKERLLSEMEPKKKISVHKPYVTPWEKGDVYMVEITQPPESAPEYQGWYIVIYVHEVNGHEFIVPGVEDMCPLIYIMMSSKRIESIEEVEELKCCCSVRDIKTGKRRYQYTIAETSNRKTPKNIEYLGKYTCFKHPLDEEEYDGMGSLIMWHSFVKDCIAGYRLYQKGYEKN